MTMSIKVLGYRNGFYVVEIKPTVGETYHREFSKDALDEYLKSIKSYCEWKGYEFIFEENGLEV